jgi:hypothetical protein
MSAGKYYTQDKAQTNAQRQVHISKPSQGDENDA